MILGLSGYARSGKDEAAKGLEFFGWQRVAFADKLREFLYRLDPVVVPAKYVAFSPLEETRIQKVRWVIDKHGWGGYKETPWGPGIRELLQRLGTECGRELISDTIWIDAALGIGIVEPKNLVVTDCRFPNEAQAIRQRGGFIVRITREGIGPANSHPSETALDDWDFDAVLDNDGTIEELHNRIANCALAFAL
jgi:hypothetical protein